MARSLTAAQGWQRWKRARHSVRNKYTGACVKSMRANCRRANPEGALRAATATPEPDQPQPWTDCSPTSGSTAVANSSISWPSCSFHCRFILSRSTSRNISSPTPCRAGPSPMARRQPHSSISASACRPLPAARPSPCSRACRWPACPICWPSAGCFWCWCWSTDCSNILSTCARARWASGCCSGCGSTCSCCCWRSAPKPPATSSRRKRPPSSRTRSSRSAALSATPLCSRCFWAARR